MAKVVMSELIVSVVVRYFWVDRVDGAHDYAITDMGNVSNACLLALWRT